MVEFDGGYIIGPGGEVEHVDAQPCREVGDRGTTRNHAAVVCCQEVGGRLLPGEDRREVETGESSQGLL